MITETVGLLIVVPKVSVGFIAVMGQHEHSNSYKGKHFIGAGLQFQRFSPLSSWQEAWQCAGRHGAGEGAESSVSHSEGKQKIGFQAAHRRVSKPILTVTHFLQQGHIYSNEATPPNSATSWAKPIQITTRRLKL